MYSNMKSTEVFVFQEHNYHDEQIYHLLKDLISPCIGNARVVVLKPNWVRESHINKPDEWEQVITHPALITAVLEIITDTMFPGGKIIITDGPQTDSSFTKILSLNPVNKWNEITRTNSIDLEIIDLRDDEWTMEDDVIVTRRKLQGDPRGSATVNLSDEYSEFFGHVKPLRGYYGADYNRKETNRAHNGKDNLYKVSRSVIEADLFINLPKLKTHKKAGITGCLKNLVGINTYKNYLPHHSEGEPSIGGDQFPLDNMNARIEGPLLAFIRQNVMRRPFFARFLRPFGKICRITFGKTENTIRSGNWYGNDTLWRTTLDLNKILFYANPDGSMRADEWMNVKNYIGIVDAILAGEGNGPLAPDPVPMGILLVGTNPVALDAAAARFMGFDPVRVPVINNAFQIKQYPICNFSLKEIRVILDGEIFTLANLPEHLITRLKPHFGWTGHIEQVRL